MMARAAKALAERCKGVVTADEGAEAHGARVAEAHRRSRLDWSWATLTVCRSSRRHVMVARLERRLEMMAQRTGEVTAGSPTRVPATLM